MYSALLEDLEGINLTHFGFVHVTGLTSWGPTAIPRQIKPKKELYGTWGVYKDKTVIITNRGQVWLAVGIKYPTTGDIIGTIRSLCRDWGDGRNQAVAVVVDQDEQIHPEDLHRRSMNPLWLPASP